MNLGRKSKTRASAEGVTIVTISIPTEVMNEVDELAEKLRMTRSSFVASLVSFGVQDNKLIIKAVAAFMPLFEPKKIAFLME